jgi:hypothetical protein
MRRALTALVLGGCFAATGCGHSGGGSSSVPTTSTATIQGVVFASSPFVSGNVAVYDFSNGSKGTLLQSTPINADGTYNTTITNAPSLVLVEAIGCYNETPYWYNGGPPQVPGVTQTANPVCINMGLDAVVGTSERAITANVTPLSHAAYGLSQYEIKQGQAAANAVSGANTKISQAIGFDVVATTPVYPTKSVTANSGTVYGGLLSGMASWLYNVAFAAQTGTVLYVGAPGLSTIDIAEAMRNDLANDGVLDGIGSDSTRNTYALTVINTPLSTTVYRHQFAKYGAIALRGAFEATVPVNTALIVGFLPALVAYNNATVVYDSSALVTLDEGGPIVGIASPTAGATLTGSIGIDGTDKDITGFVNGLQVELLIDNVHYDHFADPYHTNHFINTPIFPNGPHILTIKATNNLGTTKSTSVTVNFAN